VAVALNGSLDRGLIDLPDRPVLELSGRFGAGLERRRVTDILDVSMTVLARWEFLTVPASAAITGVVLVALGGDLLVAVGSSVAGAGVGYVVALVLMLVGMSMSAEEAGYGRLMGLSESDVPSRSYVIIGKMFVILPVVLALLGTTMASRLLRGVDPLWVQAGLALVGFGVVELIVARVLSARRNARNDAGNEAARRIRWLRDRDASSSADPEFAAALRDEGWHAEGDYDAMRAAYSRAWERVKITRRAEGRPVFGGSRGRREGPPG
jgi:hypothetical protein